MFALISSPSLFKGRGWGMGPDLPIQNYMDIDEISIRKQNLSRNEASPSRFTGGGARGWVPIKGASFSFFNGEGAKSTSRGDRARTCLRQVATPSCRLTPPFSFGKPPELHFPTFGKY